MRRHLRDAPWDLGLHGTGPFFPSGPTYVTGMPPVTSPIRAAELRRQAWRCPECKSGNDGSRTTCRTCRKEKP